MMSVRYAAFVFVLATSLGLWLAGRSAQSRKKLHIGEWVLEPLSDDVFRFRLGEEGPTQRLIEYNPKATVLSLVVSDNGFETSTLRVTWLAGKNCLRIWDKRLRKNLTEICPESAGFKIDAPDMTHAYGLGEQLSTDPAFNWVGRQRTPGFELGNKMVDFENGAVGNAQFPILYALGKGYENFALVFDNVYPQTWNLQSTPWSVTASKGPVRGYFIAGENLPVLRQSFMQLSGRPPVPPLKAFGLWVSEYGFDNWREVDDKLRTLRLHQFPIDGFVLDLQWFGNIQSGSELSHMGGLDWDEVNFPNPIAKLADYKKQNIGIITIEEPFISRALVDRRSGQVIHQVLDQKGFLAKDGSSPDSPATRLDPKAWWGNGGILDYTQVPAGDFWHDWKRQPLIEAGVIGHWTDLGEPEAFSAESFYDRGKFRHADIHNIYNRQWSASIFRGYQRHQTAQRPWILSRSGTIGSQSFGASLWSGDIGSNFQSLAAHTRAASHMSLSGVDYFGADTGGFHRENTKPSDLNEIYTQWLANAAMFDVPVRAHTLNICNCNETAPDRVGDLASNLNNLQLRYALRPYYYSLAHAAHWVGTPVVAPLVYEYQTDLDARNLGDEKMIGPFLLAASVAKDKQKTRDVYLPKGTWYDFRNFRPIVSQGEWIKAVPLRLDGVFRLPLYARAGAVVPMEDGEIRVYPGLGESHFTWFEDDGVTNAYLKGEVRSMRLSQELSDSGLTLKVGPAQGHYAHGPKGKAFRFVIASYPAPKEVTLNGTILKNAQSLNELNQSASGWFRDQDRLIVKTPTIQLSQGLELQLQE